MNSFDWKYFNSLNVGLQKMVRMYYPENRNIMWHVEKNTLHLKIED